MLSSLLDQTTTHQRPASTSDASGGTTQTWATQTANVKCAVWPTTSNTVRQFLRPDIMTDYVVATDMDLAVRTGDRFLMSDSTYLLVETTVAPYSNGAVSAETLYLYGANRRTV